MGTSAQRPEPSTLMINFLILKEVQKRVVVGLCLRPRLVSCGVVRGEGEGKKGEEEEGKRRVGEGERKRERSGGGA